MTHQEPGFWQRAAGWLLIGCGAVTAGVTFGLTESTVSWAAYGGSVLMVWAGVICELQGRKMRQAAAAK